MIRKKFPMVVPLILALIVAFGWLWQMQAQDSNKDNKTPYPSMAPLEQYLMPRDAEITLARSAAPAAISRDATVLVLGGKGYETAVKGKNGFVCVVENRGRPISATPSFGTPEFAVRSATTRRPRDLCSLPGRKGKR
jgi:hypothetical protein